MPELAKPNRRVLIVDDNRAIHDDFRKVLAVSNAAPHELDALEADLFGAAPVEVQSAVFELTSAYQGQEALARVTAARAAGEPFALAFVDMRMPPGWDGLETVEQLWKADPEIQIVICSAYSDRSWSELRERLGDRDDLLIVKKPFDTIEVVQAAHAMTAKWRLGRAAGAHRDKIEAELRLVHKLEAVGQVAAGIAHEISTPIQYVGDSVALLRELMERGMSAEHVPEALATLDLVELGIARITTIVRAMKELSHPGGRTPVPSDLNRIVANALEVSASSFRYVADLSTAYGELPPVTCFPSDLTQVLLNLLVNAGHAIEGARGGRGRLTVHTWVDGDDAVVSVRDTGPGIPEEVRERIFDPFFTTKEIGKGTGQGLSIARALVVERHGGDLTFETALGEGTTFYVRVPLAGPPGRGADAGVMGS